MTLDNENLIIHEWISKYTEKGKLGIVTGYFTIGALSFLYKTVNDKIEKVRLAFGDIVNLDIEENRPLDRLNENISIETEFKLNNVSQKCVKFLKQEKAIAKPLEPNSCQTNFHEFGIYKTIDRTKENWVSKINTITF